MPVILIFRQVFIDSLIFIKAETDRKLDYIDVTVADGKVTAASKTGAVTHITMGFAGSITLAQGLVVGIRPTQKSSLASQVMGLTDTHKAADPPGTIARAFIWNQG